MNFNGDRAVRQRVALVRSPLQFMTALGHEEPHPPLELLILAGILRERHDVYLIDGMKDIDRKVVVDGKYSRAGLSDGELMDELTAVAPGVVLLSTMWMNQYSMVKHILRLIRAGLPDAVVFVGGLLASAMPEEFLAGRLADAVVCGEGEEAIGHLVDNCHQPERWAIPGVHFWQENRLVEGGRAKAAEFWRYPLPAYDLVDFSHYRTAWDKGHVAYWPFVGMLPTRGCSHQCNFCSLPLVHGNRFTHTRIERFADELDWLKNRLAVREIHLYDAHLLNDRQFALRLFEVLRQYNLPWLAEAGLAVWTLDDEVLRAAAASGMYRLDVPVETGSGNTKKIMNKELYSNRDAIDRIALARELGIERIHGYIMIGNPGESKEDIYASFALLRQLPVDYRGVRCAKPFPGTEFYRLSLANGYIPADFNLIMDELWFEYPVIETADFNREFLLSIILAARGIALIEQKGMTMAQVERDVCDRFGRGIWQATAGAIDDLWAFYRSWEG